MAGPVANSIRLIKNIFRCFFCFFGLKLCSFLSSFLLLVLSALGIFQLLLLLCIHSHMGWSSIAIFLALDLLAPVALFSALEVVVLTLAAFPATFWEVKFVSLVNLLLRQNGFTVLIYLLLLSLIRLVWYRIRNISCELRSLG